MPQKKDSQRAVREQLQERIEKLEKLQKMILTNTEKLHGMKPSAEKNQLEAQLRQQKESVVALTMGNPALASLEPELALQKMLNQAKDELRAIPLPQKVSFGVGDEEKPRTETRTIEAQHAAKHPATLLSEGHIGQIKQNQETIAAARKDPGNKQLQDKAEGARMTLGNKAKAFNIDMEQISDPKFIDTAREKIGQMTKIELNRYDNFKQLDQELAAVTSAPGKRGHIDPDITARYEKLSEEIKAECSKHIVGIEKIDKEAYEKVHGKLEKGERVVYDYEQKTPGENIAKLLSYQEKVLKDMGVSIPEPTRSHSPRDPAPNNPDLPRAAEKQEARAAGERPVSPPRSDRPLPKSPEPLDTSQSNKPPTRSREKRRAMLIGNSDEQLQSLTSAAKPTRAPTRPTIPADKKPTHENTVNIEKNTPAPVRPDDRSSGLSK